ncbi:MAG: phosphatidylserine decarboxylase [Oscillochloridaceae bacterium umkhey_bin13]
MLRLPRLPIAPEGWPFLGPSLALSLLVAPSSRRLALLGLGLSAAFATFFRDPVRPLPTEPDLLYAPADGRILHVEPVDEPLFIAGPAWRIAIFLSRRAPSCIPAKLCGRRVRRWQPTKEHPDVECA